MKKISIVFLLLLVALIPALLGIFHSGFFLTDDGNWIVIRLSAFYEALRAGQFPVRYVPRLNNGYGYPVADFLYPLFLYLGSIIHVFHINFLTTVKILFALSLFASAIGTFLWLRKQFGEKAAFVGAIVYALFPYHIWDITKRGSLGEVLALAIIPFVFWGVDAASIYLTAIGIGLLILSHNTLALLFLFVLVGYMLFTGKIKKGILSLFGGIGLSTFFWLPALFDLQYTVFGKTLVSDFSQYFLSSQLYPLIGLITLVIILLASSLRNTSKNFLFFFFVSLLSIVFSTRVSLFFWKVLHLGSFVQFPFRFLSLTTLGVGFLAAFTIYSWKKNYVNMLIGILLILLYLSSWQYFFAKQYQQYPDSFYNTNESTTTVQNEYMPIWAKKPYISPQHVEFSTQSIVSMGNIIDKGSSMFITVQASQKTQVTLGKIYFPGWVVTIDNTAQKIQTNIYGFIVFSLPKGKHTIVAKFEETTLRIFADAISLLTTGILLGAYILRRKKRYV